MEAGLGGGYAIRTLSPAYTLFQRTTHTMQSHPQKLTAVALVAMVLSTACAAPVLFTNDCTTAATLRQDLQILHTRLAERQAIMTYPAASCEVSNPRWCTAMARQFGGVEAHGTSR